MEELKSESLEYTVKIQKVNGVIVHVETKMSMVDFGKTVKYLSDNLINN